MAADRAAGARGGGFDSRGRARGVPWLAGLIRTALLRGRPFAEIGRYCAEHDADLVVIGKRGHQTLRDLLLGSTAERLLRWGETSVLLVAGRAAGPYRRPLIATDFSEASRWAVRVALSLLPQGAPGADLVHAYDVPFERALWRADVARETIERLRGREKERARRKMGAFLAGAARAGFRWRSILRRGDARLVIRSAVARPAPDRVALGTAGRARLERFLLGSVAEFVARDARCEVLVVKPPRPGPSDRPRIAR